MNDLSTIIADLEITPVGNRTALLAELDKRVEEERDDLRRVCHAAQSTRNALSHLARGHEAARRGDVVEATDADRQTSLELRFVGADPRTRLEAVAHAIRLIANPSLIISRPVPTPLERLRAKGEEVRGVVRQVTGFAALSHGMRDAVEDAMRSLDRIHALDGNGALQLLKRADLNLAHCEESDVLRQVRALIAEARAMVRDADTSGRDGRTAA